MNPQRRLSGKAGDVVPKHPLLPELVLAWARAHEHQSELVYAETHAGFAQYTAADLCDGGASESWKKGRVPTLGTLERYLRSSRQADGELAFARIAREALAAKTYPGSLTLVQRATEALGPRLVLHGFDIDPGAVASYSASARLVIKRGDGYAHVGNLPQPRFTFIDPHWKDKRADLAAITRLAKDSSGTIVVWYPLNLTPNASGTLGKTSVALRRSLQALGFECFEAWFLERLGALQDIDGSGMAFLHAPDAKQQAERVQAMLSRTFNGQAFGKGTDQRRLDLAFAYHATIPKTLGDASTSLD